MVEPGKKFEDDSGGSNSNTVIDINDPLYLHSGDTNGTPLIVTSRILRSLLNLGSEEPNRVHQALKDPSWIEAMLEEILQFKMQKVWVLVDLPYGKRAIGTKWVFRNKKDERGIVVRNKAQLFAQGHTQEEGIDYKEVFPPERKQIWGITS
nr:putative ribonuclease H-like domain-containing protein [Tanacetum cinerariifolium]